MDNSTEAQFVQPADIMIDPVTSEVRNITEIISYVIICAVISLFGVGSNIVNIGVFVRQGFKDSINISLLGLAISDLMCSITVFCMSHFYNPLIQRVGLSIEPLVVSYLTVEWPYLCFNRITSFITTFITLERCLCIALPLKVKNIITPFRTKVIIALIFASVAVMFCPFYFVNKLEWRYSHSRNRSILDLTFAADREIVESISSFIHSVLLSSVLLVTVVISTTILVVKLHGKTKWREISVVKVASKPETVSVKEKKVVKMVILISTIFISCFFPNTVFFFVMVFYPEFNVGGRYENMLYVVWSGSFVLNAVNSSVNIFVYYNMSTKYRITLIECFVDFQKHRVTRQ